MAKGNFTFKSDSKDFTDELGREDIAELYVKFINELDGHHVVALDAPWGSGKSTLIDYMCEYFKNTEDVFVKYNAWENDYTEEPLISLMSDIFTEFKDKEYIGIDKMKNHISKISKVGKKGATALLKGASRILLGESGSNDAIEAVKEASKIFVEDNVDNLFKDIEESKKSRKEFKEELIKYTKNILNEKNRNKLIIIIDELDRCRPTFAIELLENIKHLFDIQNIVFFISIDKEQLSEAIKSVYGQGFDSYTYLHRFFDLELHLPKNKLSNFFKTIIKSRFSQIDLDTSDYDVLLSNAIKCFNLSIRDFQRIANEIFSLYLLEKIKVDDVKICIYFLILKYKEPEVYDIIFDNQTMNLEHNKTNIKNQHRDSRNLSDFLSIHVKELLAFGSFTDKAKEILNKIEQF